MAQKTIPIRFVGNEFVLPPQRLRVAPGLPVASFPLPAQAPPIQPPAPTATLGSNFRNSLSEAHNLLHRYSLISFSLLFLLVASSAIEVGSHYWSAHVALNAAPAAKRAPAQSITGFNTAVESSQLANKVQAITAQPLNITMGSQTSSITPATIKSWLKIVNDQTKGVSYIHVDQKDIDSSLAQLVKDHTKAPVNQVTVTHDGSARVVVAGRDGIQPGDPSALAKQIGKNLLAGAGFNLDLPVKTIPFQAVTPANFTKLIEVNLTSKQMYLYQNGQQVYQYAVSAGKPSTPTPIGEFHIYQKLPVQDMWGYNADGSKYFQPHVYWINYFKAGGYAIHGVYWHGSAWFGNINSSHGCVGLPDAQAEDVYDWAPIGTTVITHT